MMRLCAFYRHKVTSLRANNFRFYSTRVVFQLFKNFFFFTRHPLSPLVIPEKFLVYLHVISPDTRVACVKRSGSLEYADYKCKMQNATRELKKIQNVQSNEPVSRKNYHILSIH